jgi:ERCC4-type nuclease
MPTLIVDSNEAGTKVGLEVIEYFQRHGHSVLVKPAQADYVWANKEGETVCVERTTPSDFWGKVTSGRWVEQLDAEAESCGVLYYVVAGYRDYGRLLKMAARDIDSSFTGALTHVARVARLIPIWHEHKFPHWLLLTFEREVGLREPSKVGRVPRKRDRTPREIAVDMLATLPNVGVARAEEIASEVCSIRELFSKLSSNALAILSKHLPLKQARQLESIINADYCKLSGGLENDNGGGGSH